MTRPLSKRALPYLTALLAAMAAVGSHTPTWGDAGTLDKLRDAPTYEGMVQLKVPGQEELETHREHCSADPDRLGQIGRRVGQQVRVYRDATQVALFTISQGHEEEPESIVRMGTIGTRRLGTPTGFAARVVAPGHTRRPVMTRRVGSASSSSGSTAFRRVSRMAPAARLVCWCSLRTGGTSSPTPTSRPNDSPPP